jgi:hypothetical protein
MTTHINYDPYEFAQVNTKPAHPDNPDAIFWMVIRLGSAGVTKIDAHPTREHATYQEACAEAHRLAAKHPNHARGFAVLKACHITRAEISITTRPLV